MMLYSAPVVAQSVRVSQPGTAFMANAAAEAGLDVDPDAYFGFPPLRKRMPSIVYPVRAAQFQIEGRVYVEYTVNKKGRARDIRIIDGPGYGCEEEVERVLRASRFEPMQVKTKSPSKHASLVPLTLVSTRILFAP